MTSQLLSRFLGLTLVAVAAAALGCTAPDRHSPAPGAPQVFQVTLTASTPATLPACTKALYGTTAATESPAGIWTCQAGVWLPIPCTNILAGAVAYASATKALWACTAGQWMSVALPPGPQGQPGVKGDTGAPGADGKSGATSIVAQTVEPPGANCADGGTKVASGVDGDGDGHLADKESMSVTYVCNGAAGQTGARGAPGALLTVTAEPVGMNCPAGGQRITAGVDTNANGMLDDGEGTTVSFVCNGGSGTPGGGGDDGGGGYSGDGSESLSVSCTNPAPDSVVDIAPGKAIKLLGTVTGGLGAATLKVNGVTTSVGTDGTFTAPLVTRYGLNHVELEATDSAGSVSRDFCSFLAASQFGNENALLDDTVTLRLKQSAIDDGVRTGPIDSLADVLATVLESEGLRKELHEGLLKANPLYDESPDRVDYLSLSLPGPNTVSAALVGGGIKVHVRFEDPLVRLQVTHDVFGISVHTLGDATGDFIEIDATFDVAVAGGRPRATLRPGSTVVNVGTIDTHFDGLLGFILNIAVDTAQGFAQDQVAHGLQDAVAANLNTVLDGVVSSLDVAALQGTYSVPRFDGTGSITMAFGAGFSTADATTTRALVGLSTKFVGPTAHTRPPTQVPLPTGTVLGDPAGTEAVAVAEHVGVLQQALQAYWRGGGLDGAVIAGNSDIAFTTTLPPVVFLNADGTVGIDLGIDTTVSLAGFPLSFHARAAARARATVTLANDDLIFSAVMLDEVHVVTPEAKPRLKPADMSMLNDILGVLLAQMAERSLNDALPRLPVPAFTVPEALGAYGLPVGKQLGITGSALTVEARHAVLRGGFGVR